MKTFLTVPCQFVMVQVLLFAGFIGLLQISAPVGESPVQVIAILLMAAGILVLMAAVYAYYRANVSLPNVSPTFRQGTQLVTTRIYRFIRHPIYTGVLLVTAGVALYHGALLVMAAWLAFPVFFNAKAAYEEAHLRQLFARYAEYQKTAGRFLPRL